MRYDVKFSVDCDLSQTPLMEAALYLGPSFYYEIRVHATQAVYARHLVRSLAAASEPHPFAPCIRVVEDNEYGSREWSVHANGKSMGSSGVS